MTDRLSGQTSHSSVPGCDRQEALVALLYGEAAEGERAAIEAHLRTCASCVRELAALRQVRTSLARWEPPDARLGFRITRDEPLRPAGIWRAAPAMGLAAAAVLMLAAAAAIANLEVRYDRDGFVVRTGRAGPIGPTPRVESPAPGIAPAISSIGQDAWRVELTRLEDRLRAEMKAHAASSPAAEGSRASEARLLARVRALIVESETRQAQAQALRIAGLVRDMQAQRQADLIRVQRGLGQIEGQTNAQILQQRDYLNHFLRVSQRQEKQD